MRSLVFGATVLALAEGGTLNLAFKDCGAAHGKAIGLTPTSVKTGSKSTITGAATVDEDVSGGVFEIDIQVAGFTTTFEGDWCQPKTFKIPLDLGSFSWDGAKCPQAKGDITVPVDLQLSSIIPHGMEDVHLTIKGISTTGDDLLCMQVDTSPAELTAAAPSQEMQKLFADFMKKYHRQYATEAERSKRFKIFSDNMQVIHFANARNVSYKLGVTSHTDQTSEEWRAQRLTGFKAQPILTPMSNAFAAPANYAPPPSVDWVAKGGVTPVKNQGDCGSCWTFSTVGALEGAMFVAGRPLVELSMQNFLACDSGGNGCNGGSMVQAFQWAQTHGVPALKSEPYLCVDRSVSQCANMTCPAAGLYTSVLAPGTVTGVTPVADTEGALEAAVAQQPVSVAIEADQFVFQHYTGGILTDDACGSNLDHGVLAVGYGVDNGQAYWKVKNSWGPAWGEHGYIRIEKGKQAHGGECGIRKMTAYPTVAKPQSDTVVV